MFSFLGLALDVSNPNIQFLSQGSCVAWKFCQPENSFSPFIEATPMFVFVSGRLHEDFGILPDVAARLETRDCEPHQVWRPRWNWGWKVSDWQYTVMSQEVSKRSVSGL